MKVLLDEDVPNSLRDHLSSSFEVETVSDNSWQGYDDPDLLSVAEQKFDAHLTLDTDYKDEQLIGPHDIGVVLLDVHPVVIDHLLAYKTEMLFGIPMAAGEDRLVIIEDQFEERLLSAASGDGNVREELVKATSR